MKIQKEKTPRIAGHFQSLRQPDKNLMGEVGREHPQCSTGNTHDAAQPGADSGASVDLQLSQLIQAWPNLTREQRGLVLAVVRPPPS